MSEEKARDEKEVKSDNKLEKQVANIAFTVRKIKNKLEEQLGMDIDGDGRIGSGPYKKALIFLLVAGMASFCMAEDRTAIAYWSSKAKITSDGFVGDAVIGALTINNATVRTNATVGGTLNVAGVGTFSNNVNIAGATTSGSAKVTGSLAVGNGLTVNTNATIGGTLGVTGVVTFTATPLLLNGLNVRTNAIIGGTLTSTGAITGPISAANLTAATVASAVDISAATNLPTAGMDIDANSRSLLDCADYSAMRTALTLVPGTDVQAYDADLTKLAGNDAGSLTNIPAGNLAAGGTFPAVNGSAITDLSAANLTAGSVATAFDGSAITNVTATVTLQTGTGYDATGAAITNAAGDVMAIVTNLTVVINP